VLAPGNRKRGREVVLLYVLQSTVLLAKRAYSVLSKVNGRRGVERHAGRVHEAGHAERLAGAGAVIADAREDRL